MTKVFSWIGQVVLYAAFALFIGVFSHWPAYQHLPEDHALIKLSLIHHGQRLQECKKMTPEELAKLPPNMRAPMACPRERSPITVEVDIDGVAALRKTAQPSGLSRDGAASVYQRIEVPAGTHRLDVRLRDSMRTEGFDFERNEVLSLKPAQILVIDFSAEKGGITLQ
ncbi:hypothetical protein ACG33_11635 [Steroidobacter denitrificans]|uniref:Uncharacterized protein n=1 Tax=Steroidobacter denitrificans TaxID=465721 RepID=A0A127FBE7_STEDE|nr:hypothetical protein ACG33_11635 [Steroidobacter denitrificans]